MIRISVFFCALFMFTTVTGFQSEAETQDANQYPQDTKLNVDCPVQSGIRLPSGEISPIPESILFNIGVKIPEQSNKNKNDFKMVAVTSIISNVKGKEYRGDLTFASKNTIAFSFSIEQSGIIYSNIYFLNKDTLKLTQFSLNEEADSVAKSVSDCKRKWL